MDGSQPSVAQPSPLTEHLLEEHQQLGPESPSTASPRFLERRGSRCSAHRHLESADTEALLLGIGKTRHRSGIMHETWLFFNADAAETGVRRWAGEYEMFSIGLVVVLVIMDILDSCEAIAYTNAHNILYQLFIRFSCLVFSVEYVLRVWSCVESEEMGHLGPFLGRLRYILSILPLIDLSVLIAFYLDIWQAAASNFWSALRMVRLLRILALLKLERNTNSFRTIYKVLVLKKAELIATLFTACVLMVVSATLMYYIESPVQPDKFPNILVSMWWGVTALTTVGYGDIYPVTPVGKFTASVVAFFGVGLFALPAGILGSGFVEILQDGAANEASPTSHQNVKSVLDGKNGAFAGSMDGNEQRLQEIQDLKGSVDDLKQTVTNLKVAFSSRTDALESKLESVLEGQRQLTELLRVGRASPSPPAAPSIKPLSSAACNPPVAAPMRIVSSPTPASVSLSPRQPAVHRMPTPTLPIRFSPGAVATAFGSPR